MNFGPPIRFRSNYRPSEDEDSSDNETGASTIANSLAGHSAIRRNRLPMSRTDDLAAVSGVVASSSVPANRWRQSNPIRSPRGVEQRMRFVFCLVVFFFQPVYGWFIVHCLYSDFCGGNIYHKWCMLRATAMREVSSRTVIPIQIKSVTDIGRTTTFY